MIKVLPFIRIYYRDLVTEGQYPSFPLIGVPLFLRCLYLLYQRQMLRQKVHDGKERKKFLLYKCFIHWLIPSTHTSLRHSLSPRTLRKVISFFY